MGQHSQIDRKAYELAKAYLPSLYISGVTTDLVEKYLKPEPKPTTKNELYLRILESAQNANMRAGAIGKSIGGVDKLAPVLCNFNPKAVLDTTKLFFNSKTGTATYLLQRSFLP